jgi:preprotein translocase subunit SecE
MAYTAMVASGDGIKGSKMAAKRTNPFQFIQEVRAEGTKITWPTRREVILTTAMVMVMSTIMAIFFSLVDLAIRSGLQFGLGFFG